jgi:hypothetical protein
MLAALSRISALRQLPGPNAIGKTSAWAPAIRRIFECAECGASKSGSLRTRFDSGELNRLTDKIRPLA